MIARAARRFRTCGLVGSGMRGENTAVSDRVASVRASGAGVSCISGASGRAARGLARIFGIDRRCGLGMA